MITLNPHQIWHARPLHLTSEQTQNLGNVIVDFFECYALQDVREILSQWITNVTSSRNCHTNRHYERNDYLFFYEKLDALIEAAWIISQETRQSTKQENKEPIEPVSALVRSESIVSQTIHFTKPPRPIEKTTSDPIEVIREVFDELTLCDLTEDLLPNWLQVALINTQSPYSNGNEQRILIEFYELLITFVTKLYIMAKSQQFANPSSLFTDFFHQCPIDYVRRELADFLEAGIGHDGAYPNDFSPWQAWMTYNHVLCLIEASYQLYSNQHMQAVTIRLYSPKKHDFV